MNGPNLLRFKAGNLHERTVFNFMQKKYTAKFPNLADEDLWANRRLFSPEFNCGSFIKLWNVV